MVTMAALKVQVEANKLKAPYLSEVIFVSRGVLTVISQLFRS